MTDYTLISVVKDCLKMNLPILKEDAARLVDIIDRQQAEIASLTEKSDHYRTALNDNERLIADMQGECTCGAWEHDDDEEYDLSPLPDDVEALPDIRGFAATVDFDGEPAGRRTWSPVEGKRLNINGIICILHSTEESWRLTDLVSGVAIVTDNDPAAAIRYARSKLDDAKAASIRLLQAEHRAKMPPNPELDAIIAREVGSSD